MSTTLFLDFDGVVNLFNSSASSLTKIEVEGYTIRYKQSVVDALNQMHDDGINIVWLTDWQLEDGSLDKLEEAIGFRKFDRVQAPKRTEMSNEQFQCWSPLWWKKPAHRDYLVANPSDKAVWLDDSHINSAGEDSSLWWKWINPNQGVTVDQLDKLTKWLSE